MSMGAGEQKRRSLRNQDEEVELLGTTEESEVVVLWVLYLL